MPHKFPLGPLPDSFYQLEADDYQFLLGIVGQVTHSYFTYCAKQYGPVRATKYANQPWLAPRILQLLAGKVTPSSSFPWAPSAETPASGASVTANQVCFADDAVGHSTTAAQTFTYLSVTPDHAGDIICKREMERALVCAEECPLWPQYKFCAVNFRKAVEDLD